MGKQVKTENWEAALFKQMASQPASMLAAKTADAYGCLKGHTIQQADAVGAYTQAPFLDKDAAPTWVRLPEGMAAGMEGQMYAQSSLPIAQSPLRTPAGRGLLGASLRGCAQEVRIPASA